MSAQSWEYTRQYAGVFGQPPAPFVTAVRALLSAHAKGESQISGSTRHQMARLLRSPSLFAPFYFAAYAFEPSVISSTSRTPELSVLKVFSPHEVASILAVTYLWRRAQSFCDAEEIKFIEDSLAESINMGLLLGRAIPAIGGGLSLLQAVTPILGVTAFLRHDSKGFQDYRRLLKKQRLSWNCELEIQQWGCTRIQIGSVLVQSLGFGIMRSTAIASALSGLMETGSSEEMEIARDVQMAARWCESIRTTGQAPEVALPAKYYPTHAALQNALSTLATLQRDRSQALWIQKGRADLPPYQLEQGNPLAGSSETTDEFETM